MRTDDREPDVIQGNGAEKHQTLQCERPYVAGAVFLYQKERYVMAGQLTGGAYYRAYGRGKKNFPAKDVQIIRKNAGLVYVA